MIVRITTTTTAIVVVAAVVGFAFMPLTAATASGYLHFKPDKGAVLPANHFVAVNGTSAPSNATHTNCNVQFQTNGHGYQPVTPKAPNDYTKWTGVTNQMIKPGINSLEAQLQCFPPAGSTPNLVHHLVHNVTGAG